jgi:large subunit ribosomal protein L1
MKGRGKKYIEKSKAIEAGKLFPPSEAVKVVKGSVYAKFDEAVDLAVVLGVDVKKGEQVRGTVVLPAGIGKNVKIGVIAKDDKAEEAKSAGADYVGSGDLIDKIKGGWLDFDVLIATPDMMGQVGRLGKILGQRGLMPNPKSGTVTADIAKTVKEFKSGKIEFRADKAGVLHLKIGKVSFDDESLLKNFRTIFEAINKARPSSVKGTYVKSVTLSSTMGPGVKVDSKKLFS